MKVFEFVLALIVVLGVFQIIRLKMGLPTLRKGRGGGGMAETADPLEAERLRNEVRGLKERVQVLERIVTDKEDTLTREIDSLRDK